MDVLHLTMRSRFSRPNTPLSVGRDPPHPPLCFFTLRAGVNTSAPACCTDFTQPRQMVLTLHWAHAAAPGTLGKSFRALATLSESTCTYYKHRCSSMCAGMCVCKHAQADRNAIIRLKQRFNRYQAVWERKFSQINLKDEHCCYWHVHCKINLYNKSNLWRRRR